MSTTERTAKLVEIEIFKEFIKDGKFEEFVQRFTAVVSEGATVFTFRKAILCGLLSPEAAANYLYSSLKTKLMEKPDLISKIHECLESDEIVE